MNLKARSSWLPRLLAGALSVSLVALPNVAHAGPVATPVHVRKEVSKLKPAEIASLRKGVKVMKSRPATDPTSWSYQAAMHGSYVTPPLADWNQCQHGSYFFLAWHRMYLYYFERILRKASGDPNLSVPYWNYSQASSARRALPAPFRRPANASNPLYVAQRAPALNAGTAALPRSATSFSAAFAETDFTGPAAVPSFGGQKVSGPGHFLAPHGQLESQPHDIIHDLIGGGTGWMSDPNTAAQDPIFYLHHANIDRLWKRWLALGGGRANPTDAVFLNTRFFFYDENGARVAMTGSQILNTVTQLGYRYDDDPVSIPAPVLASRNVVAPPAGTPARTAANVPEPRPALLASSAAKPPPPGAPDMDVGQGPRIPLGTAPVKLALDVKAPGEARLRELATGPSAQERPILLNVEGIEFDQNPGVYYEIYVNLPKDQAAKANFESPSYVGNLGFFGLKPHGHAGHDHQAGNIEGRVFRTYDITRVLSRLKSTPGWNGQLTVTFVMKGLVNEETQKPMPVSQGTKARIARVDILGM